MYSPTSATFAADGGTGTVNVVTDVGCPWIVQSSASWLKVTSAPTGFGNGKISFSVARNSGNATRTATLDVTGNLFTVTQAGAVAVTPDLALAKSHSGGFTVGGHGTYTLTVTNIGAAASSGIVTLTDALPAGLSFVSAAGTGPEWSCSASGSTVTCTAPAVLQPGASSTVLITVAIAAQAAPAVINSASITNSSDPFPENNTATDPTFVFSGQVLTLSSGIATVGAIAADASNVFPCRFNQAQYAIEVPSGALQLIISLDAEAETELLVSYGQPITPAANPSADFSARALSRNKKIYIGPYSKQALAAGTYFISLAQCSASPAAFTLTASVITAASAVKIEELAVDDGTRETGLGGEVVWNVNRLRPLRFPSKLRAIRVYFSQFEAYPDPVGTQVRVFAFSDPAGLHYPLSSPALLFDQVVTIPGREEFVDFPIEDGPVIFSGDW